MGLIESIRQRASLSLAANSTLKDPQDWFVKALIGATTPASGERITEDNAISVAAVLGASRVLTESFGATPFGMMERRANGRYPATDHPSHWMVHRQPNPYMTAIELREWHMWDMLYFGACYSEKELDNKGNVIAEWPLLAARTTPVMVDGVLVFKYLLPGSGESTVLPEGRVWRCNGMMRGRGLIGESVIMAGKETIGNLKASDRLAGKYMSNGMHLSGFLQTPNKLSDGAWANLNKQAEDSKGIDPAYRVKILEEGLNYVTNAADPRAAQMLESRQFERTNVSAFTRVPPSMLGDLTDANRATMDGEVRLFFDLVMDVWFERYEQARDARFLTKAEQKTYYFKFTRGAHTRGDIKTRFEAYRVGRQWGWLSGNQIAELEDQNPFEGGDERWAPMNMVPASRLAAFADAKIKAANAKDQAAPAQAGESLRPFVRDAAGRMVKRVLADLEKGRELDKALSGTWIRDALAPIGEATGIQLTEIPEVIVLSLRLQAEAGPSGHEAEGLTMELTDALMRAVTENKEAADADSDNG